MIQLLDYKKNSKKLRRVGREIDLGELTSPEFQANLEEMKNILALDGVGLAATQVDWPVQVFMLCIDENSKEVESQVFINPIINTKSKKQVKMEEGCLSFKNLYVPIKRSESINWSYTDLDGNRVTLDSSGFYARAVQHEIDHCNGHVFIDRASVIQKSKINKWLKA